MRRRARIAVLAACSTALVAAVLRDWPARWLVLEDPPAVVDAAVVLAGDPDYERTISAARLVLAGQAKLLVLTGGELGPGDSALSLRAKAIALGVPPERIRCEEVSRSTREALVALAPLFRREAVTSVALVTSPYHQRRAFWTARHALPGLTILNRPAQPSSWCPDGWWRTPRSRRIVLSEYGKLVYYAQRGWLAPS